MSLVDELLQEGAIQSSGVFSLDLRQRLLKLAESQLGSLGAAVLCLVEAAVAAKAERISCRSQGGSWDPSQATLFLAFHGDNVRLQEAAESQLFGEAIELLRSRGLRIELVDCRGGTVVDRVSLTEQPPELTKAFPAYESELTCQAVILQGPALLKLQPRRKAIFGRLAFMPLELRGRWAMKGVQPATLPSKVIWQDFLPHSEGPYCQFFGRKVSLGWMVSTPAHTRLTVLPVHRGRLLEPIEIPWEVPGVTLVAPCDHLQLDLSRSRLIENEHFREAVHQWKAWIAPSLRRFHQQSGLAGVRHYLRCNSRDWDLSDPDAGKLLVAPILEGLETLGQLLRPIRSVLYLYTLLILLAMLPLVPAEMASFAGVTLLLSATLGLPVVALIAAWIGRERLKGINQELEQGYRRSEDARAVARVQAALRVTVPEAP